MDRLRICIKCRKEAINEKQLSQFVASKRCKYGKLNLCKNCFNKMRREKRRNPNAKWSGMGDIPQPKREIIENPIMDKIKWAYWAGVIDCDGAIGIHKLKRKRLTKKYPNTTPQFQLIVELSNTCKKLVDAWANILENRITTQIDGRSKRNVYINRYSGRKAYSILKKVLPYLIYKKERALVGIDYIENGIICSGRRVSNEEYSRRKQCWLKMRGLIQRGE